MRIMSAVIMLFFCLVSVPPASAQESQPPEAIIEKMSFKFVRGITNILTCVGEIPKQTMNTIHDRGSVGYVIGPLKGVGMTIYRGVMGVVETAFFMVPQPGYYDPMVEPEFVWHGWGESSVKSPAKVE